MLEIKGDLAKLINTAIQSARNFPEFFPPNPNDSDVISVKFKLNGSINLPSKISVEFTP